jgi:hypothetical protein
MGKRILTTKIFSLILFISAFVFFASFAVLPSYQTAQATSTAGSAVCGGDPNYIYENGTCMPKPLVTGGFTESSSITDLIIRIVKYLLLLSGAIAVGFVVFGGFQYITSAGNAETAEKGKNTLINAIIGIIVVVLAYAIITVITTVVTKST